ncbi:MAG: hypothetical protein MHM6MM_007368 [Cercozoa sp. M6MM]
MARLLACPVGDLFLRVYLSTDEPSSHSRLLPALFPKINSAQIERLQRQPDEWVDKPLKPLWNLLGRSVFLPPSEKEFYVMWTLVELSHPVTLQGKEQRDVTDFASNYSDEVRAHVQNYRGAWKILLERAEAATDADFVKAKRDKEAASTPVEPQAGAKRRSAGNRPRRARAKKPRSS